MVSITHELWVCQNCTLHHANGECGDCAECSAFPQDVDHNEPLPWALWPNEQHLMAMGAHEHSEECGEEDRQEGCECGMKLFSTLPCDACGSRLHGDRYAFVKFDR